MSRIQLKPLFEKKVDPLTSLLRDIFKDNNYAMSWLGALSIGIGVSNTNNVNAQDSVEEVIVTASKKEQNIQDVAMSVQAISSSELEAKNIKNLEDINAPILIVSSTYGQGDVPDGSKNFYNNLKSSNISLEHIKYAVFGLGDMTYKDTFAYGGKKFDHLFLELNANRIGEPFYHDASDGSLPEEEAVNWFKEKIFKFL